LQAKATGGPSEEEVQRLKGQLADEQRRREEAEGARDAAVAREESLTLQLRSRPVENDGEKEKQREREVGAEREIEGLRRQLELKDDRILELDGEVKRAREEAKGHANALQEALLANSNSAGPVQLDSEFRDIGRLAIIAMPHLTSHLQSVIDNQDRIRAVVPVTTLFLQALETARARCMACIPQSVPQLVSLLVSRQPSTVREASFALALTSLSPPGRKAILAMPQAIAHLETLLASVDKLTKRHGALALGNLAMEQEGRKNILGVFEVIPDLVRIFSDSDLDCRRSASLAIGNVVIEDQARDQFLKIPQAVKVLSEQLKSPDRYLVRYTTGAMRNVAVDEKGRRAVLAQQEAVAALKGLLASPDQTTAKFAASALNNLSMTPFSVTLGPTDPRTQVPENTNDSFMGFKVPFADEDGLGIPRTAPQAVQGSISL